MKKGAVIIGVDKTGELPILNAAGSGAVDFSNWANKQGFDVTLLIDTNDRAVTVADISTAINQYVQAQTYSQLIVYFSGHGILRSPDYELWLLSGSPANPNEAVNLSGSILMARNARIKHIVFISDACRSRPNTFRLNQVTGSVVFPNEPPKTPRPTVDVFYATLPGDTALEIPPDEAVANYRGIFTECILKGLNGTVAQIIVEAGKPPQVQRVVPSWHLKGYLEIEVPQAASAVSIKLQQEPDIRVESHHPPSFLSLIPSTIDEREDVKPVIPDIKIATFKEVINDLQANAFRELREAPIQSTDAVQSRPEHIVIKNSVERIVSASAQGRKSFGSRTGFTIIGAVVKEAIMDETQMYIFEENGHSNIKVDRDLGLSKIEESNSILIIFSDGTGVLLAVLPGFIGTIVVEDGRVITVNYTPYKWYTEESHPFSYAREEVEKRRAFIAVAARNGSFRIVDNQKLEGYGYWYMLQILGPTLGLYASYSYLQTGRIDDVQSILEQMINMIEDIIIDERRSYSSLGHLPLSRHVPVLFDVGLLAGERYITGMIYPSRFRDQDTTYRPIVMTPGCPMLTQGWAYIDFYNVKLNPVILEAGRHLQPGLWTTFTGEGVSILREALLEGNLI